MKSNRAFPRIPLTESEREYAAQMYSEFGCLFGTNAMQQPFQVGHWVRQHRRRKRTAYTQLSKQQRAIILAMRLKHIPYAAIREQFGVTNLTIWEIQRDAGYQFPNNIG